MKHFESLRLYEKFYTAAIIGKHESPDSVAQAGVVAYTKFIDKLKTPKPPDVILDSLKISSRLRGILWNAGFVYPEGILDVKRLPSLSRETYEVLRNMGPKTMLELDKLFETLNIKYL